MTIKGKRRLVLCAISAGVMCVALLLLAWCTAPWLLTADSGPVQSRAMVVLGGTVVDRGARASQLYAEVKPDLVVVTGDPQGDGIAQLITFLTARGVPANRIRVTHATSTYENATSAVPILREHHITNAVVVTSWFHSRRALATFRKVAPDIHFSSRPTAPPAMPFWWPNKYERPFVNLEFAKILYYALVHGVPPW